MTEKIEELGTLLEQAEESGSHERKSAESISALVKSLKKAEERIERQTEDLNFAHDQITRLEVEN